MGLGLRPVIVSFSLFTDLNIALDDILAVGHYLSSSDTHKKAEILNTRGNTWSAIADYPYDLE